MGALLNKVKVETHSTPVLRVGRETASNIFSCSIVREEKKIWEGKANPLQLSLKNLCDIQMEIAYRHLTGTQRKNKDLGATKG